MDTSFEESLPASIQQMLDVEDSELGDFSEALRNQTILARLSMRRVLKGARMEEYADSETVETDDNIEQPMILITEKDLSKRMEIADRANRTLTDIKAKRLEAIDRYAEKAEDKPKPAQVVFKRAVTSPRNMIMRFIKLERFEEAKTVAKDNCIPWEEFEHFENRYEVVE